MADPSGFQEQIKRLSELVAQLEQMPDSPQKTASKDLVQLLMEVHAQGLQRLLEIVFESSQTGGGLIDRLGKDDVVGGLLLLYSLHPDALETRVETALEKIRARLHKLACAIDLVSVDQGAVLVRVTKSGHSCGSSADGLRNLVEDGMFELAPDITSLEILGLEEQTPAGFVRVESLVGSGSFQGSGRHIG